MESLFYLVNHSINTLVLSISIIMSLNDKVKVLWKTKCTWRDHAHWPKRREIKLLNQDDTLLPLKPGNAVKIKFGSRWYDAEVPEHWKPKSKKGTHLYNYTVTFFVCTRVKFSSHGHARLYFGYDCKQIQPDHNRVASASAEPCTIQCSR